MEYIRSHEAEKLFELLPIMEAIRNGLKQSMPDGITRDDYIYSLAIGNKPLDNMPPSGAISNPTCNIATNYVKVMKRDTRGIVKSLSGKMLIISKAIDRISCSFRRLPSLQQEILQLHYWDKLSWREISIKLSENFRYISPNGMQELKRKGIEKLTKLMQFPQEEYSDLVNVLLDIAK